jgi:anti-sigma regulatory factor (Ser/Thr protein kinase)
MTVVRTSLPPEPSSVPAARRVVRQALSRDPPAVAEVVELLATELVSNAVKHARTPLTLEVEHQTAGGVRLRVDDDSAMLPVPKDPLPARSHGYGLQLVDALATEWGATPVPGDGKTVWCLVRPAHVHEDASSNGMSA